MSSYRIGTAARLSGLPVATLRNWELRYGLITARRTSGGQRLYSAEDVERLTALRRLVDQGLSAGEAHSVVRRRLRARPSLPDSRHTRKLVHQPGEAG
jgi:MerR family transcriptional regulator, light-induced transcriptional regulator